jgi:hypothetical protein
MVKSAFLKAVDASTHKIHDIVGPANQTGCIILRAGNLAD